MYCCVKVVSWLPCVCIGVCLWVSSLHSLSCFTYLHICTFACTQCSSVGVGTRTGIMGKRPRGLPGCNQAHKRLVTNLPATSGSRLAKFLVSPCLYVFFQSCASVLRSLYVPTWGALSYCVGGPVRWMSGHGATCHQFWFSKLPDCTKKTWRPLASTWIF